MDADEETSDHRVENQYGVGCVGVLMTIQGDLYHRDLHQKNSIDEKSIEQALTMAKPESKALVRETAFNLNLPNIRRRWANACFSRITLPFIFL